MGEGEGGNKTRGKRKDMYVTSLLLKSEQLVDGLLELAVLWVRRGVGGCTLKRERREMDVRWLAGWPEG